jgi:hypothetical protein
VKLLAIIFAFLTVALTMYPCDDELLVSSITGNHENTSESHGHGHKGESDHCSPFCVCAISTVQIIEEPIVSNQSEPISINPNFSFLTPFTSQYVSKLIQPPQV